MSTATMDRMTDGAVVAAARAVTMRFGSVTALDDVTLDLRQNTVYGLLGRNGAGKTTLMQVLTGQLFQTSGEVRVHGAVPHENPEALRGVSFIQESQPYPADYRVRHVLAAARHLLPRWDEDFARDLLRDFDLPADRKVKKLSRGMTSALGVIIGLASRAPLTLFDEPYLGLDAVARQLFYDRLLADYAENPRTIVLSTHLIDEVADLLEHVVVIDHGRVVTDSPADELRGSAIALSGATADIDSVVGDRPTLRRESLGNQARVLLRTDSRADDAGHATSLGLTVEPVSLQQLIVETSNSKEKEQR
ncbi:ABC transporter ATP-binding protein [Nocardia flavorosea]|uniref:ABC transporter ATP-binding protein n=1 Tax=Nocardia flavorosea TaxID=53429 RepID=UPI0018954D7B|nr:ABC transporter ATP-binding protein [Nocardia flavorosea]MBF6352254.1 ABC transporter ATP-binding protein [Nocardia flavorosea]